MRKLALLPIVCLLVFFTGCVYEDYDKPTPTETFADDVKVLYIVIDGVRYDALTAELAPNMMDLIDNGNTAWTTTGVNENITWSGPNWSTLLTGVHHQKHNVKDNAFVNPKFEAWPTIFYRLESIYMDIQTASIVNWDAVNDYIVRNCADITEGGGDNQIENKVIDLLENDFEIDFIFTGFDDVDHAGHTTGFTPTSATYAHEVTVADERVGNMMAALQSRTTFATENWLVVITTDHGGQGLNHAGDPGNPNIRNVFSIFNGDAVVNPGHFEDDPQHVDIATTVLKYFGITSDQLDGQVIAIE